MSRITRSCGPSASRVRRSAFHASDSFSFPAIASTIFAYTFGACASSPTGSARNMPNISAHSSLGATVSLFVAVGSRLTGSCLRHHLAASAASLPSSPFGSPSSFAMPIPRARRSFRLFGAPAVAGSSHAIRPISLARMFTAVRPPPLILPLTRASARFSSCSWSAISLISFMARTSSGPLRIRHSASSWRNMPSFLSPALTASMSLLSTMPNAAALSLSRPLRSRVARCGIFSSTFGMCALALSAR